MMQILGSTTVMDGHQSFHLQATCGIQLDDVFVLITTMVSAVDTLSMVYEYFVGRPLAHVCCYFRIWPRQLFITGYINILKRKYAWIISDIFRYPTRISKF